MNDERQECPNRAVPFLVGAALGAAIGEDAARAKAAQIRREIDRLAEIERARLAEERKLLALAAAEAQRNEADRIYRQSVLWLEHCNNDERLEWLARGHGATLADELAARAIAKARERPDVAALFEDVRAARQTVETCEANKRSREALRDELGRRRWTRTNVGLVCATVGLIVLIPFWARFGAEALVVYVTFLTLSIVISPLVVWWQPTPKDLAPQVPGFLFSGPLRKALTRVEDAITKAKEELSSATIELALTREAVAQAFRPMQPALLAEAKRHFPAIRTRIGALQAIYPPRVRCDLAAIADEKLHAHLAPHLPAALERAVAAMM